MKIITQICKVNKKQNIAVFASGNGSNALRLMEYFKNHSAIKIELLVCNNEKAAVLQKADEQKVSSVLISKDELQTPEKLLPILQHHQINFIVLAGFLLQIPSWLIQHFENKIINIHPSLLPKYGGKGMYGKKVHEAVLYNKDAESGISIHFVNEHYDEGEIIFQATCKIDENENVESLAKKIQQLEHENLPKVVEQCLLDK